MDLSVSNTIRSQLIAKWLHNTKQILDYTTIGIDVSYTTSTIPF
jgi:ABC-type uncharacterized transport system ATPase subunit